MMRLCCPSCGSRRVEGSPVFFHCETCNFVHDARVKSVVRIVQPKIAANPGPAREFPCRLSLFQISRAR